MRDRISPRPDLGEGITVTYRNGGLSDTADIFRNGERIGTADSTRDCTGNAWGILANGNRYRFSGMYVAMQFVVAHGRPE